MIRLGSLLYWLLTATMAVLWALLVVSVWTTAKDNQGDYFRLAVFSPAIGLIYGTSMGFLTISREGILARNPFFCPTWTAIRGQYLQWSLKATFAVFVLGALSFGVTQQITPPVVQSVLFLLTASLLFAIWTNWAVRAFSCAFWNLGPIKNFRVRHEGLLNLPLDY